MMLHSNSVTSRPCPARREGRAPAPCCARSPACPRPRLRSRSTSCTGTARRPPHTTHHTLPITHLTLPTTHCSPYTTHCPPHTTHCPPHNTHLTPHTTHCLPHTTHHPPHTAHHTPHNAHRTPQTAHHTPHPAHRLAPFSDQSCYSLHLYNLSSTHELNYRPSTLRK